VAAAIAPDMLVVWSLLGMILYIFIGEVGSAALGGLVYRIIREWASLAASKAATIVEEEEVTFLSTV